MQSLSIGLPDAARSQVDNEHLVLRIIPSLAVKYIDDVGDDNVTVSAPIAGLGHRLQIEFAPPPNPYDSTFVPHDDNIDGEQYYGDEDGDDGKDYPGYRYQDQVVRNLVERISTFIDVTLNDCGREIRNRRRAVAKLRDGLTNTLAEHTK